MGKKIVRTKVKEAINNVPKPNTVETEVDLVMAKAKEDSDEAVKNFEKVAMPKKFDRKKAFISGEHQPKPEEAEKELAKISLDESLFEDYEPGDTEACCEWCGEEELIPDLKKTNFGWLCNRCIKDLQDSGEDLTISSDADYDSEHHDYDRDIDNDQDLDEDMFIKRGLEDDSAYDLVKNAQANKAQYSDNLIKIKGNKVAISDCELSPAEAQKFAGRLSAIAKDLEFRMNKNESLEEAYDTYNNFEEWFAKVADYWSDCEVGKPALDRAFDAGYNGKDWNKFFDENIRGYEEDYDYMSIAFDAGVNLRNGNNELDDLSESLNESGARQKYVKQQMAIADNNYKGLDKQIPASWNAAKYGAGVDMKPQGFKFDTGVTDRSMNNNPDFHKGDKQADSRKGKELFKRDFYDHSVDKLAAKKPGSNLKNEAYEDIEIAEGEPTYVNDIKDIADEYEIQLDAVEQLENGDVKVVKADGFSEDDLDDLLGELPYLDEFEENEDSTELILKFTYDEFNKETAPGSSAFGEELEYQQKLVDNKSGEEVIISGKNKMDAELKAKKFKQKNGGDSKFTDAGEQKVNDTAVKQVGEAMQTPKLKPEEIEAEKAMQNPKFIPGESEPFADMKAKAHKAFEDSISEEYDDVETFCSKDMQNGNAFWIMGYCANAMKECGLGDEIGEMRERAMSSDYDNLCKVCDEYIQRCNELDSEIDDDYQVEGLEFVTDGLDITKPVDGADIPNIGERIIIVTMEGEPNYDGKEGEVLDIDDIGQLHGTWGGLAVIPGIDKYEIIG